MKNKELKEADFGYVNIKEAAKFFHMSPHTLRKQLHAGLLPSESYMKTGRNWIFSIEGLSKHYRKMADVQIASRLNG